MFTQSFRLTVSPAVGEVSAIYATADRPVALLTLAHGAGAGMHHPFMETLAAELVRADIATLRFNFPFVENGKRRPDTPATAHLTIAAALRKARELAPDLPLFAAGKSFGGRMSSQYLAAHPEITVSGLVFFGFPLHAAGRPSTDRAEHLHALRGPLLFLQGTRDTLADPALIASVCASLPTATLVRFEGADHSFKSGKSVLIPQLVQATANWLTTVSGRPDPL